MRAFALLRHDDGVWDNPQGAFCVDRNGRGDTENGRADDTNDCRPGHPPKPVVSLPDQGPAKRWNFNV